MKVLTIDAGGFGYRRMVRLLFESEGVKRSPLSSIASGDAPDGLTILARALTRGQGKTEGLHERRVPVTKTVRHMLLAEKASDLLAAAATERVKLAGEVQNRVLKPALYALFENGPGKVDLKDKGAESRARDFLASFDHTVDATFFDDLWGRVRAGRVGDQRQDRIGETARRAGGWPLVQAADRGMSKAIGRRWRALARADAMFRSAVRRNDVLQPYLRESPRDDAA